MGFTEESADNLVSLSISVVISISLIFTECDFINFVYNTTLETIEIIVNQTPGKSKNTLEPAASISKAVPKNIKRWLNLKIIKLCCGVIVYVEKKNYKLNTFQAFGSNFFLK